MSPRRGASAARLFAACAALGAGMLGGCAGWGFDFGGSSSVEMVSTRTGAALAPAFVTSVYSSTDDNTADLYLSDLSLAQLAAPDTAPLDSAAGSVVHIHYFITPYAGRTPIDFQASNVTIRFFVLAPASAYGEAPTIGIYGGGGFLLPSDEPEGDTMGGRIEQASLRLTMAAPGFNDRVAIGTLDGKVRVTRDEVNARAIAANLAAMLEERGAHAANPSAPDDAGVHPAAPEADEPEAPEPDENAPPPSEPTPPPAG